jgi:uncharacterized membrane protein YfcA
VDFPVAHVPFGLAPYLIALGFAVGVCGGLWGMGGGWIIIPALQAMGMEAHVAIGTSVAQILGNSIISSLRHWGFGNVSLKIAVVMIPGRMLGVEVGVRILEYLKQLGPEQTDLVIGILYIILLFSLAAFIFAEVHRASQNSAQVCDVEDADGAPMRDEVGSGLAGRVQGLKLYPCISCKVSDISSISVWVIGFAGLSMGIMTGLLGVGGGLVGMPLLVYVIGCPTPVAVGTSMASAIVAAVFGTFRHAMNANADLPMAMCLLIGAAIGIQIGAFATRYVKGAVIRGLFAVMALVAGISVVLNVFLGLQQLALWLVVGTVSAICLAIIYLLIAHMRADAHIRSSSSP